MTRLYSRQKRDANIELIKKVLGSKSFFEEFSNNFEKYYHPSFFAEFDFAERTCPPQHLDIYSMINFDLFDLNQAKIIEIRNDLSDDALLDNEIMENFHYYKYLLDRFPNAFDFCDIKKRTRINRLIDSDPKQFDYHPINNPNYKLLAGKLLIELHSITDMSRISQVFSKYISNSILLHLDKTSTRLSTKSFLEQEHMDVMINIPTLRNTGNDVSDAINFLQQLKYRSAKYGLNALWIISSTCLDYLETTDISKMNEFQGMYNQGLGPCGKCSMYFTSETITFINSSCKFLHKYGDDTIFIPQNIHYTQCPYCKFNSRLDVPTIFHTFSRQQIIYMIPSNFQNNKEQAINSNKPFFKAMLESYKKHISDEQISNLTNSSELMTFGWNEFIYAIQMGDTAKESHVYTIAQESDGSGLIIDSTKKFIMEIPPDEMIGFKPDDPSAIKTRIEEVKALDRMQIAMDYYNNGDYEKSAKILEELYYQFPDNHYITRNYGIILNALGKISQAQSIFSKLQKFTN